VSSRYDRYVECEKTANPPRESATHSPTHSSVSTHPIHPFLFVCAHVAECDNAIRMELEWLTRVCPDQSPLREDSIGGLRDTFTPTTTTTNKDSKPTRVSCLATASHARLPSWLAGWLCVSCVHACCDHRAGIPTNEPRQVCCWCHW